MCILRNTYTKIGTIQRRLAWPLRKDDTQIREAFHIFPTPLTFMFLFFVLFVFVLFFFLFSGRAIRGKPVVGIAKEGISTHTASPCGLMDKALDF